jgi:hypothetical protein
MKRLSMFVIVGLLVPRLASAQVAAAVVEVGANLYFNTVTAAQSITTAANMILSVANQVLELTPVDAVIVAGSIGDDMAALGEIVADAEGLMQDLATLQALFSPHDIPPTLPAMRARVTAMDEAILTSRNYALKAQTLLRTLLSTVEHLTGLIGALGGLVGNMQGNQTIVQVNATMSKSLAILTTQTAGAQRMETLVQMREAVIVAMDQEITRQYWAPYFPAD